jgi:sec-independent protein translocase protein TatA
MGIGTGELILIFLVILLLFGAKRLPDLAKSLGKSLREFKKAANDIQEELQDTETKLKNGSGNSSASDKPEPKE